MQVLNTPSSKHEQIVKASSSKSPRTLLRCTESLIWRPESSGTKLVNFTNVQACSHHVSVFSPHVPNVGNILLPKRVDCRTANKDVWTVIHRREFDQ